MATGFDVWLTAQPWRIKHKSLSDQYAMYKEAIEAERIAKDLHEQRLAYIKRWGYDYNSPEAYERTKREFEANQEAIAAAQSRKRERLLWCAGKLQTVLGMSIDELIELIEFTKETHDGNE